MKTHLLRFLLATALLLRAMLTAHAAVNATDQRKESVQSGLPPFASLLILTNYFGQLNPKVLTVTGESDATTVGIHYELKNRFAGAALHKETLLDASVHSEGLVVAEPKKSPNRLLTHGVRLSAINLLPRTQRVDDAELKRMRDLAENVHEKMELNWKSALREARPLRDKPADQLSDAEKARLANLTATMSLYEQQGREALKPYGKLVPDEDPAREDWVLDDGSGKLDGFYNRLLNRAYMDWVYLSFDLDGNAETDQTFRDVQWVGSAQLRGQFTSSWWDYPFYLLRGGQDAKNQINRYNGPYFWFGVAEVDASNNEARKKITADHQHFGRAQAGVFYRTEVFGTTADNAIALELGWQYYHEFNAPESLRRKDLATTSYFKATLLIPGNYFLEYTDGKLPLDVESASTVSVGWRHNF